MAGFGCRQCDDAGVHVWLILWDVRKYYIVLVPLVFLKGFSALAYLGVFLIALPYRGFWRSSPLIVTAIAMVVFARRAYQLLSQLNRAIAVAKKRWKLCNSPFR